MKLTKKPQPLIMTLVKNWQAKTQQYWTIKTANCTVTNHVRISSLSRHSPIMGTEPTLIGINNQTKAQYQIQFRHEIEEF